MQSTTIVVNITEIFLGEIDVNGTENWTNYSLTCEDYVANNSVLLTTWFQITIYFLYTTVFVVALVGNGLVCYVVYSSPRMKTVTNYFIVNLAVGDILMDLFCVPTTFVSTLILQYWPFALELCPSVNYSQVINLNFIIF